MKVAEPCTHDRTFTRVIMSGEMAYKVRCCKSCDYWSADFVDHSRDHGPRRTKPAGGRTSYGRR